MIFELLIIIFAILLIIYLFLTWNFNYWEKRGVTGPKPKILYGNLPNAILQKENLICDIEKLYKKYKNQDNFIGIFLINKPILLTLNPEIIHEILVTKFKYFNKNFANFFDSKSDPILAQNPFLLTGAEWKQKRSEVTPGLTISRIKSSHTIMMSVCNSMTKYIENEIKLLSSNKNNDGINGRNLAARYTIEVVANCIYGFEAGAFKNNEKCQMLEMGSGLLDFTFFGQLYMNIIQVFPALKNIYSKSFVPKKVHNYFTGLMEYAIKLRKQNQTDRIDFLNYLLQLQQKKNLSSFEMAAHTITFFFDGFETSSVLISNCLYLLSKNQNIQENLRNEIRNACLKQNDNCDYYDLINDLSYLDQVVNETFRLMPPASILMKECTEACELINSNGNSVKINKGDIVQLPILLVHHDEQYYTEPQKFNPERFNEENGGAKKYKDMGVFLPFGDGPRACLGQKFALAQSKAALFELIKNWKITLNEKTLKIFEPDPFTMFYVPKGGIWLNFEKI